MVAIGTPDATPLTTNTLTPTGGVMSPISMTITQMTPNHMGSDPRPDMIGNTTEASPQHREAVKEHAKNDVSQKDQEQCAIGAET